MSSPHAPIALTASSYAAAPAATSIANAASGQLGGRSERDKRCGPDGVATRVAVNASSCEEKNYTGETAIPAPARTKRDAKPVCTRSHDVGRRTKGPGPDARRLHNRIIAANMIKREVTWLFTVCRQMKGPNDARALRRSPSRVAVAGARGHDAPTVGSGFQKFEGTSKWQPSACRYQG